MLRSQARQLLSAEYVDAPVGNCGLVGVADPILTVAGFGQACFEIRLGGKGVGAGLRFLWNAAIIGSPVLAPTGFGVGARLDVK